MRLEGENAEGAAPLHSTSQAVVVTRQDSAAETRLVAYVKLHGAPQHDDASSSPHPKQDPEQEQEEQVTAAQLRNHLLTNLPPYMAPSSFVVVEQLPHLPNGKVDYNALPDPMPPIIKGLDQGPGQALTALESAVMDLFSAALGVDRMCGQWAAGAFQLT